MIRLTLALVGLILAGPASGADGLPPLRLCTGQVGNNYHAVGQKLAASMADHAAVQVVATRGSWENLEAIDAEPRRCDAIIAQDDAYALYLFEKPRSTLMMDRIGVVLPEYVHLLCNRKAQISSVADLDPARHTVLTHLYGSGTYITWSLFGKLNRHYARLKTGEVSMEEGLLKVVDGVEAQCLVLVTATGGATLDAADGKFGDVLALAAVNDARLHRKVGRDKRPVYRDTVIPKGTYGKLATADLPTQAVDAVFFVNPEWRARYPAAAAELAKALVTLAQ